MATTCPKCRFENPDDTNFCGKCAAPLPAATGKTPEVLTRTVGKINETLANGTLIAAKYRITAKLGAGGMGEVYRAEDLNLNRQVAIKVLPDVFAADPERLARFQREAKVLAAFNHPNIAAIYGVEEAEGRRFLVLELVEGETLAERLARGPLSVEETLDVCRQIAEGLESAHEKNIIHRDLKPSNVKVTPEGKVKILDFGLARAFQDHISDVDIIKSPTITADMTRPGVILGTAAYMSPEQAKGKFVDKRTDIWAFGCMLYECLTGKRAFEGETITETLASILKGEPDWQNVAPGVPHKIRDLIRRCLQKDPKERLHDIADARLEIADESVQPSIAVPAGTAKSSHFKLAAAVVALSIVLIIATSLITWRLARKLSAVPVIRSSVEFPEGVRLTSGPRGPIRTEIDISPDGRHLVFSASPDGSENKALLYLRAMDSYDAKAVPGTEGGRMPFFSPDGNWIGFWAQQKLMKVSLDGGIPSPICDCRLWPAGVHWGPKGQIVIGTYAGGLQIVEAGGGQLNDLTTPDRSKEETHRLPYFLPDGKAVLFTTMPHFWGTRAHIEVFELETRRRKPLNLEGADARFLPTGHLVYMKEGLLMAVPFDSKKLEVHGSSRPIINGVLQAINEGSSVHNSGSGQYAFSASGSLAYASGGIFADPEAQWYWIDRLGKKEPVSFLAKKPVATVRLSPTNPSQMAYETSGKAARIWLYDLLSGVSPRPLTPLEGRALRLIWNPSGNQITLGYSKAGSFNLYEMPADGSGPMEPLVLENRFLVPSSWSRDGKILAYIAGTTQTGRDIHVYSRETRRHEPFMTTDFDEMSPEISPNGKWLAFSSTESGRWEIWITSFPKPGKRIPISQSGGVEPVWSPDGRELFYWNPERTEMMVAEIEASTGILANRPRKLLESPYAGNSPVRGYDISPDGKRFLVQGIGQIGQAKIVGLNIVLNWFEELKRLIPAGKK